MRKKSEIEEAKWGSKFTFIRRAQVGPKWSQSSSEEAISTNERAQSFVALGVPSPYHVRADGLQCRVSSDIEKEESRCRRRRRRRLFSRFGSDPRPRSRSRSVNEAIRFYVPQLQLQLQSPERQSL